jgi:hypothetical protein
MEIMNMKDPIRYNCILICTDYESNMISLKNAGLYNRMTKEMPYLVHVRDLSHSMHSISEHSISEFPQSSYDSLKIYVLIFKDHRIMD